MAAIESCNVKPNKWAMSPVSAGGSPSIESCNATIAGPAEVSVRLPDSSIKSGTWANKESCNAHGARERPLLYPGCEARHACTRATCVGPLKYLEFEVCANQAAWLAALLTRRHGAAEQ